MWRRGGKATTRFLFLDFLSCPSSSCMAPLLQRKVFLIILCKLRFARDYTKRCLDRLALLLAFLASTSRRKFRKWWHSRPGKSGASQTVKRGGPSFLDIESGGPAIVKQCIVATSSVPASASLPNLHERVERQPATAAPIGTLALSNLSAEYPHGHNILSPFGGIIPVNLSSGNPSAASIQSRASDRFSIITTSRDSLRGTHGQQPRSRVGILSRFGHDSVNRYSASMGSTQSHDSDRLSVVTTSHNSIRTTHGQRSRPPRGAHRQFGRGPNSSRSRERPTRPNTPHDPARPSPDIITTNPPSLGHEDSGASLSPTLQPSASSPYAHGSLGPSPIDEIRRKVSLTSFTVDVQNPSTESLPISLSTANPITDEPLAMESATTYSSPDSPVVDQHDEQVLGSRTSSNAATSDYFLPEGRFVQLFNSDQVPRYTKNVLMQVEYTILPPHPYISLQTSRVDTLLCETFNNYIPLVSCNLNDTV